ASDGAASEGAGGDKAATDAEVSPVGAQSAEQQRQEPGPELVPLPERDDRAEVPEDKYAMAGGCYAIQDVDSGNWIVKSGDGYTVSADSMADASGFHFQATDLGRYLLYDPDAQF